MVEAIVEATARVLVREGYEGTNTNRIADVAGISVGSLYQYFPSKEALVAQLIARHTAEMWALYEAKLAELEGAPLEHCARELIRLHLDAHRVDPKLHRVLMEQVPRVGGLAKVNDVLDRVTALITAQLERRRAEIVPQDPALAAFVVVHTVESISHQAVLQRPDLLDGDELVEEMLAIVMRYLIGGDSPAR